MRPLILLVILVGVSNVQASSLLSLIPENYQGYLNERAKSDLDRLRIKDVQALRDVATRVGEFTSLSEFGNAIVEASPRVAVLAKKYANEANQSINQVVSLLSPSSKRLLADFANLGSKFAEQVKSLGQEYVQLAKELIEVQDVDTIENLKQVFGYDKLKNIPAGRAFINHFEQ